MDTIKNNVMEILRTNERARNDDTYLLWLYWSKVDGVGIFIPFDKFKELTSFETIRRSRQLIQNEMGLYPPTQEVSDHRQKNEEETREYFAANKEGKDDRRMD